MKHVGRVTLSREIMKRPVDRQSEQLAAADAKTNLMNGMWRVWSDYVYEKKNELGVS